LTVAAAVVATRYLFARPLRALAALSPITTQAQGDVPDTGGASNPLPLTLRQVSVSYSGSSRTALAPIDLRLDCGELVAIVGPNGAGKSTLARVIAGLPPTAGDVQRPGGVGRGLPGGTASIFQRPDSQVLGVRVGDDLVWGHTVVDAVDVDKLLSQVGLAGFADRETATLSGGELQRVAIASALGRQPVLLISDESTAMLDKAGRAGIVQLFRSLTDDGQSTVLHVTHHPEEELAADRSIKLTPAAAASAAAARVIPLQASDRINGACLSLRSVSFSHDAGSPWERAAVRRISIDVRGGETVLLTGANGAGKTTLAWLMAGLLQPTSGDVLLDGEPVHNGRDGAVLGLQHSRQQLLRPTVIDDVRDAAGVDRIAAAAALDELGLAPGTYADRRVDELSGGEQRRVALAGLIACRPRALVLDEPLAGLDTAARTAMTAALRRLRAAGLTLVIISHDTAELLALTDAVYELESGSLVGTPTGPQTPAAVRHRRPSVSRVVGRALPGDSFARRLWVGTKIGVITALAIMVGIRPTWITVGVVAAVLAVWTGLGRVPRGAVPRLPRWFIAVTPLAGVLAALGGKTPYVTIGGYRLSVGGINQWALFTAIAALSLYASMLFTWTTPAADIPPFLQGISRLCRRLHLPAEATTATIAVGLRLGPLLLDECRTVYMVAAQRHRSQRVKPVRRRRELFFNSLALVCALAIRRAGEMAEAMVARGRIGSVAQNVSRPAKRDLVISVATLVAVGLGLVS
jgi:energy-coupling factor transporter ATP-binding protein EcfA2